ncbi:SART-1 protein [Neocallimastix californiae]|uniref:SART-1 protein n=1 Tax=Neocallimastix californiae TaxID=1754190 RepID=A0A1Y2F9H7_9FUNG|nr:SART-1 protein [Neocallimastix californiae]|eukprot:ORY80094.1 SART-1 protein [Neocallimastix californiae]
MAEEEISLSIEETNKLRISLGLKPLSVDNEPKKESAEDNYEKYKDDLKKTEETKRIQEKIQRSRNKRELKKKLSGKGLGEVEEGEDDDALAWIKRQKKRQKELADMKRKQLEEMDNEIIEEYKSENLKGLKVGHDISEIEEGEEEILVLKDAIITEDDDAADELISNRLTEREKLQKNLELKKKKNIYGGVYDDEEALYGKKKILSQYDDDENESRGFILNGNGEIFDTSIHKEGEDKDGFKKGALDLNYNKMQEIKDYYTKDEMVSFKKPKKKKKKKHTRRIKLDGEDNDFMESETSVDSSTQKEIKPVEKYSYSNITSNIDDVNFIDDDELQIALSKARRKNTKKLVKSIKETVQDVKLEDKKEKEREEKEEELENEENLLSNDLRRKEEIEGIKYINEVSETSEFVRNIPTLPLLQRQNQNEKSTTTSENNDLEKEESVEMESENESNNEENEIQENKEKELEEGERAESEDEKAVLQSNEQSSTSNVGVAALEEEPLISSGMAATVSLLLQKGIVNPVTKEELEKERLQIEKEKWLNEQKINDIIKERRKQKDHNRKDRHRSSRDRDRDYDRDDLYRERERAREAEKKFKNYKPVVNIEYHDEFGRTLTQKEAFRELSHKFHGKTSGKLKTEKRLKKLEEELKLKQMSSTDTPLGTVSALQEKTKAIGSAHLVLSIGNRGVLPSENDVAGLQPRTNAVKKKTKENNLNESISTSSTQKSSFTTTLNDPGNTNAPKREKIAFGLKRKAEQEINPVFKKRE